MIIEKSNYRLNPKTKTIIRRQIVKVQCDQCQTIWKTAYGNVQRKRFKKDLCASCRSKERWKQKPRKGKILNIKCAFCKKDMRISKYLLMKNSCCSRSCSLNYAYHKKYHHLDESLKNNPNEVAYLIGLVMGDGHLKKNAKKTTRISIACDAKKPNLINLATSIMDKLQIKWFQEPLIRKNCVYLGFTMPDKILDSFGIMYSGNKYKNQPYPNKNIINNINYVAGLINSDGHSSLQSNGKPNIVIVNTVKSIIKSALKCLYKNKIHYTHYEYKAKKDKRTNKIHKNPLYIVISREYDVNKLKSLVSFKIKEAKRA